MPIEPDQRRRLAAEMDRRRLDLGFTWQEVADLAGLSLRALVSVRTGSGDIRPLTRRSIDKSLQWTPGRGVDNILAGRAPEPADPFLAEVLADIDAAVRAHGGIPAEEIPGKEIFYGRPLSGVEAFSWDDSRVPLDLKPHVIASMRAEQHRYEASRQHSRSGTAGLRQLVLVAAAQGP